MSRTVVLELPTGAVRLRRLGQDDPDSPGEELAAIEVAWTGHNGGVRPRARVLQEATLPSLGDIMGAAGATPPRRGR